MKSEVLTASVGGLGLLLGPLWAVLIALGAFLGGLGKASGRKVAISRAGTRSGKGSGRKVAQIRAGKRSGKGARPPNAPNAPTALRPCTHFFL